MTKREKNRPYELRATEHTRKTRHPAIGDVAGWTCLKDGCNASAGLMASPSVDDGDNSWTYEEFWGL